MKTPPVALLLLKHVS